MVLGKPLKISELKAAIRTYYKKKQENDMLLAASVKMEGNDNNDDVMGYSEL